MKITNGIYSAEDVARLLEHSRPAPGGNGYLACCPAHEDKTPSLSIKDGDKGIVIHCFAGCSQMAVMAALSARGAWPKYEAEKVEKKQSKLVKEYNYVTENGELLFQVCRFDPKDFRQRVPDGNGWKWSVSHLKTLVPYRLPEIIASSRGIIIVEGEKDADNLAKLGVTATTFAQGAGKWRNEYAQWFKDRVVYIIPDNDESGRGHANLVAANLHGVAKTVKIISLPDLPAKGDISDWIAAGGTKEKLAEFVKSAEAWEPVQPTQAVVETKSTHTPEVFNQGIIGYIDFPDVTDKGRVLGTIENMDRLCDRYGITARYNVVSKEVELNIPGKSYLIDNSSNCSISEINSLAGRHRMPTDKISQFVLNIADRNSYNPVIGWVEVKPWDGVDRFEGLLNSLDPVNRGLAGKLLKRWLISAIAALYRPGGLNAGGMLVLQGEQYLGKTAWFWSLTNGNRDIAREAAILNPHDKDSVIQVVSYWLVELGEIDATFKRSDIEALKGFITRDFDRLRRAYAATDSKYPRRTVLMGTVNPKQYLNDTSGNRRFWTIECGNKMNAQHGIDVQQLWAQVKTWFDAGESWLLSREENALLSDVNLDYLAADPIEELIMKNFDMSCNRSTTLTASEVLLAIGYDRPNMKQTKDCSAILRKITGEDPKRSNGKTAFRMPAKLEFNR